MPGPGDTVGLFRLGPVVGRGGMGVVHRAEQPGLERDVALKVVSPQWSDDEAFRARFRAEARLAAAVEHPNVLPVYDAGEADGVLYLAMRLVEGPDLGILVRHEGPLPPARAARIVAQVAAGLQAAHAVGLVHRDVKPTNVLVSDPGGDEHVYLADFGLARLAAGDATVTADGRWAGTADYAAPEQIRGERGDARTDVYAAGGVLFWALTGRVPFPHATQEAKLWAHLHEAPPVPSELVGEVPPALDAVVARALAKAPEDRYPSAAALARAVSAAVAGDAPTTLASAVSGRRPSRRALRPRVVVPALAALAALGGVMALAAGGGDQSGAGAPGASLAKPYDLDGDGRQDVVVGLPGRRGGAAVAVLGGGRSGGSTAPPEVLRGAGRGFAAAVASADFDADGYADLAVGAPDEDAGAVTVLFGSRDGIGDGRTLRLSGPAGGARFGSALVAGDLDGDGFADLVVGAPGDEPSRDEDIGSGTVRILFGAAGGGLARRSRTLARPRGADADFGSELALGDVDGDRHPDLAEAADGRGPLPGHGSYCDGGPDGPHACAPLGPVGPSGPAALAVGDVTGDGLAEVLQGVPDRRNGAAGPAGAVVVWAGTREGPGRRVVVTQDRPGVRGHDQPGDAFGAALAVSDLDGDGHADIVVGVPGEDDGAGRVVMLRGGPDGPVEQRGGLVPGRRRPGDRFGDGVSLLDTDGDGRLDLAITNPGDGSLTVLRGTGDGYPGGRPRTIRLPPSTAGAPLVLGRRGGS